MRQYLSSPISYLLSSSFAKATEDGPICRSCDAERRKSGFTLIELLIVIAVVAILATLVTGAAQYAMRTARQRRMEVSCKILETALFRYRTEYGYWPDNPSGEGNSKTWSGKDNAKVFGPLRVSSDDNPDKIGFIDETTFLTKGSGKLAKSLHQTSGDQPLVFQTRSGKTVDENGNFHYFTVTVDFADDTVKVTAPGFNDE